MVEWKEQTIGEATSLMIKGIAPIYAECEVNNAVYVLNQKCNRNFAISFNQARWHNNNVKPVPHDRFLQKGDVLINSTGTGTAGRVSQIWSLPGRTTIDGHMILMRAKNHIDSLYYGYVLKMNQKEIESFAEGSTGQTEINKNRLVNEILIKYPDDKVLQHRIAEILFSIDEKIYTNNAINNNLSA